MTQAPSVYGDLAVAGNVDGMIELTGAATVPAAVWTHLAVVAGIAVLALRLGTTTLRRRTA